MNSTSENVLPMWKQALEIQNQMNAKFNNIVFSDLIYVYNPTVYASDVYKKFLKKFLNGPKTTLLLGINPAPWGMCQTGIAFTSPEIVQRFNIEGTVHQPKRMHPKKPVIGLECDKYDPSGKRLWGLLDQFFPDSNEFFDDNFILNYCPLAFFEEKNGHYTSLSKLERQTRETIEKICDDGLVQLIELIKPKQIVCFGVDSSNQIKRIQKKYKATASIKLIFVIHPSPNTRIPGNVWTEQAKQILIDNGWSLP